MKKFVCKLCGYVHEGDTPPEICPLCGAPASEFIEEDNAPVDTVTEAAGKTVEEVKPGMDPTVLYALTYGLYVVGAMDTDGRPVGCIINTCFQVTSQNPRLAISINKDNYTYDVIRRTRRFSLSIIAEDTDPMIISWFGFTTSRDRDKYADFGYELADGVPLVNGIFCGRLILEAEKFVDCGTHFVVIARLSGTVPGNGTPMTYAYYHKVIKGKAPKNAPTYVAEG